jgi:hypothetical protein
MVWKLDGDTALWDRDGVQLKAPLGHIQRGLEWSMDGREESKSRLFQIDLRDVPPPRLADAYVRGDDVVVFYPEHRQQPYSLQLDFRALQSPEMLLGLEVWVSVQTQLLECYPAVQISFRSQSAGLRGPAGDPGAPLMIHHQAWTPACTSHIWVHPLDAPEASWSETSPGDRQSVLLFGKFMEKGVIRRARLQWWLGSASLDPAKVAALRQQFAISPLPLTA